MLNMVVNTFLNGVRQMSKVHVKLFPCNFKNFQGKQMP